MNKNVQQLIDWSEWGRQWVEYLRQKPHLVHDAKKDLHKFSTVFVEIGRKAESYLDLDIEDEHQEISYLTAKAEEIQGHFHRFLRIVQERSQNQKTTATEQSETEFAAPLKPVPIGGHTLPPLPYEYDALEPHIDAETMRIHHDKLHRNYVNGLNKAEKMMAQARAKNDYELIKHWEREASFHGAGHYLHTLFWNVMSPTGGGNPQGELAEQIIRDFGSIEMFKKHFSQAAEKVEGGGWAILVWSPRAQRLEILQAEKHQNLSQWDVIPLLVLDVWEHSYFLNYRSDRAAYIDAWWNVVNWPYVQERYLQARRLRWQPY